MKTTVASFSTGGGEHESIIGLAIWTHMLEPPPADIAEVENVYEVWPDHNDREFMARLWRSYVIPRSRAVKNSGDKGVYGESYDKRMWVPLTPILHHVTNHSFLGPLVLIALLTGSRDDRCEPGWCEPGWCEGYPPSCSSHQWVSHQWSPS